MLYKFYKFENNQGVDESNKYFYVNFVLEFDNIFHVFYYKFH